MFVLKNEGRRRKGKKKLGIWCVEVRHGRATTGTGRAKLLVFGVLVGQGMARPCHCRHGPCQGSGSFDSNFFFLRFLESCSDNYLQNNLKQTKSD